MVRIGGFVGWFWVREGISEFNSGSSLFCSFRHVFKNVKMKDLTPIFSIRLINLFVISVK